MRAFDILGNIAILKQDKGNKKRALEILKNNKSVSTVVEKIGKFKGRLRKMKTKYLVGEKTKEVLYKENGCVFRFNLDETYFSPRLSNERKEIASKIKKNDKVLVMFAGVAPFSIVIAKKSGAKVVSNEINKKANKYAELNVELNKLKDKIVLVPGDIKKVVGKLGSLRSHIDGSEPGQVQGSSLKKNINAKNLTKSVLSKLLKARDKFFSTIPKKFDVIVMPRPQLRESFLKEAFKLSKKGTRIFYYDFCKQGEEKEIIEKIKLEAKNVRKKIKILEVKSAGEIAPYKIRVRIDFIIV